jgi:molybdopterin-containing oxidoreductase family iron-sulfur binding subunit
LNHEEVEATKVDLWTSFDRSVHHFNLSIDLNACTGVIVMFFAMKKIMFLGKSEIRRSRDMHWLRIDRYYSSESTLRVIMREKIIFLVCQVHCLHLTKWKRG